MNTTNEHSPSTAPQGAGGTAGPLWRVERTFRTHNHPCRYWETAIVDSEKGYLIANTAGATKEEAEEIAALLAAAPEMKAALEEAQAALTTIRKCSIAGAEHGYGKPELWCEALFASHGDVASALKTIERALSASRLHSERSGS